jgi:hypothetical protein
LAKYLGNQDHIDFRDLLRGWSRHALSARELISPARQSSRKSRTMSFMPQKGELVHSNLRAGRHALARTAHLAA